jgi:hypothetical protein
LASWRRLRSRIMTPDVSETRLEVRGFHVKNPESKQLLETIGRTFLSGFSSAAQSRDQSQARQLLDQVPVRFRGFAYEGAAMGFSVLDGLSAGGHRTERFLRGPGAGHVYMVYVGMGWAMARLPRLAWRTISAPDPLLRWLVLDGYGFHQAYFHTDRYVRRREQAQHFPWPRDGSSRYALRAIDQGIGRALWFVCGTDTDLVAETVAGFPAHRQADLYSGVGLAATYAGGAGEGELRHLWELAGAYRPQVAQGSAFAAEARLLAGLMVPHVELATQVLCDTTPALAAKVCAQRRPTPGPSPDERADDAEPAYENWRQNVAAELAARGRC